MSLRSIFSRLPIFKRARPSDEETRQAQTWIRAIGIAAADVVVVPDLAHPSSLAREKIAATLKAAYDRQLASGKSLESLAREIGASVDVLETCASPVRLDIGNLPVAEILASRLGITLPRDAIRSLRSDAGISGRAVERKVRKMLKAVPDMFVFACPMSNERWCR